MQVADIPVRSPSAYAPRRRLHVLLQHTINGKKVEIPIKKLLNGAALSTINSSTLRNSECLEEFVDLGAKLRAEVE